MPLAWQGRYRVDILTAREQMLATEGFAISAPLSQDDRPSWSFLAGAGLIGGGPTFAGGVLGDTIVSPVLSILFLGLAAGALVFGANGLDRRVSAQRLAAAVVNDARGHADLFDDSVAF